MGEFHLPVVFDLSATFLFGTTGALAAVRRGYDYVGVFCLAFVSGVGGGLIRDGIFLQQGPPFVMRQQGYLLVILASSVLGVVMGHHMERYRRTFLTFDAVGMAAYGVVGVQMSLNAGVNHLWAVIVGVVNAVGGGVLRDVLTREEPVLFKPGQYYVLASLTGCVALIGVLDVLYIPMPTAGFIGMVVTFVVRFLCMTFDIHSKPAHRVSWPALKEAFKRWRENKK